jgi:hypothetical protein
MIPTINHVVHRKWPQIERHLLRPMKNGVQHHRSGPRGDRLDGSFGCAVLMMRSNARERDGLTFILEVIFKFGSVERCVVCSK